ncbi:MAG: hypothetical protein SGPRY_004346 [Prymnesium sp.]
MQAEGTSIEQDEQQSRTDSKEPPPAAGATSTEHGTSVAHTRQQPIHTENSALGASTALISQPKSYEASIPALGSAALESIVNRLVEDKLKAHTMPRPRPTRQAEEAMPEQRIGKLKDVPKFLEFEMDGEQRLSEDRSMLGKGRQNLHDRSNGGAAHSVGEIRPVGHTLSHTMKMVEESEVQSGASCVRSYLIAALQSNESSCAAVSTLLQHRDQCCAFDVRALSIRGSSPVAVNNFRGCAAIGVSTGLAGLVIGVLVGVCFERLRRKRRPATCPAATSSTPQRPLTMAAAKAAAAGSCDQGSSSVPSSTAIGCGSSIGCAGMPLSSKLFSEISSPPDNSGEEAVEWGHFESSNYSSASFGDAAGASGVKITVGARLAAKLASQSCAAPSKGTLDACRKDSLDDLWETVKKGGHAQNGSRI